MEWPGPLQFQGYWETVLEKQEGVLDVTEYVKCDSKKNRHSEQIWAWSLVQGIAECSCPSLDQGREFSLREFSKPLHCIDPSIPSLQAGRASWLSWKAVGTPLWTKAPEKNWVNTPKCISCWSMSLDGNLGSSLRWNIIVKSLLLFLLTNGN